MAFSPDGETVYTVGRADTSDWRHPITSPGLVAWEVPIGKKRWRVGVDRRLEQVANDPDGKSDWVLERRKSKAKEQPDQVQRVRGSTSDGKELARTAAVNSHPRTSLHPTGRMALLVFDEGASDDVIRVVGREGASTDVASLPLETLRLCSRHVLVVERRPGIPDLGGGKRVRFVSDRRRGPLAGRPRRRRVDFAG